jgi:hypothetical protein
MRLAVYAWLGAGLVAGAAQAVWLWRAAASWKRPSLVTFVRIPVVVGSLAGAAVAGALTPAAAGWAAGLGTAGLVLLVRSRR